MDRAPTVAIIGQASTSRLHKESHQNMDSIRMLRPISKWAHSIYKPDTIPEMVRKAFKIAEQEKPGVTVLELPEDIAKKEAESPTLIEPRKTRRAAADHKAVKAAVDATRSLHRFSSGYSSCGTGIASSPSPRRDCTIRLARSSGRCAFASTSSTETLSSFQ